MGSQVRVLSGPPFLLQEQSEKSTLINRFFDNCIIGKLKSNFISSVPLTAMQSVVPSLAKCLVYFNANGGPHVMCGQFKKDRDSLEQAIKSTQWMPWCQKAMKDVISCDKLRTAASTL